MISVEEKQFFLDQGYLHVKGVLSGDYLQYIQTEFDRVWELHQPRVSQHQLLQHRSFIELIEHPPILDRQRAIFGTQVQLIQYDLLRQGPNSQAAERFWHRDFTFPGDRPLAINTIVMLDDMTEERGPTRVVPQTHTGEQYPPADKLREPLPGELGPHLEPGDAIFINGAIWHTGGRNKTGGTRRGIYLYYGYWWLKRYNYEIDLPWQALENAGEQRLRLLGEKMPGKDLHMYEPDVN